MGDKLSPAQRANQITFVLKGDLKNVQIAYLRAGSRLAKIRDEQLYRALKYPTIEDYARAELGLGRSSLFRYLQIHDWVLEAHAGWLAKHPKGFIPDLAEAGELMWIENALENPHIDDVMRAALEAMRRKALAGKLTESEFEKFRCQGEKRRDSLTAVAASARSLRRRLAALPNVPATLLGELDAFLDHLKAASGAVAGAIRLANAGGKRLRAAARKSPIGRTRRTERRRK